MKSIPELSAAPVFASTGGGFRRRWAAALIACGSLALSGAPLSVAHATSVHEHGGSITIETGPKVNGEQKNALTMHHGKVVITSKGRDKAVVDSEGTLKIDGTVIPTSDAGREALAAYNQQGAAFDKGVRLIASEGVQFAKDTLSEVFSGVFTGGIEEAKTHAKQGGKALKARAMQLCDRLDAWRAAQDEVVATVADFKPYAVLTNGDIKDCHDEQSKDDEDTDEAENGDPPAPPVPPAIAESAAPASSAALVLNDEDEGDDDAPEDDAAPSKSQDVFVHVGHAGPAVDGSIKLKHDDIAIKLKRYGTALISSEGDLEIDQQTIKTSEAGRAVLAQYHQQGVDVIHEGEAMHKRGVHFAVDTIGEVLASLFSDKADHQVDQRIEKQGRELGLKARGLCDKLDTWRATQDAAASLIPEFKPYAVISKQKVADCQKDAYQDDDEERSQNGSDSQGATGGPAAGGAAEAEKKAPPAVNGKSSNGSQAGAQAGESERPQKRRTIA